MDKRKVYQWSNKHINASNMKVIILLIPLMGLFIQRCVNGQYNLESFLDISILISFFTLFICEALASWLLSHINAKCEDAVKLTEDYETLVQKYSREELIEYNGVVLPESCLAFRKKDEVSFLFDIELDVTSPVYQLPTQIAECSDELMKAHEHSVKYNNMNVRLNDCRQEGNKLKLLYGRTTYFDSLVSNRAMDFPIKDKSIREIYEPGPFLSPLSESKLSNHLGFNGFVELQGGKIIFVHRNADVSIGKKTLGTSVATSYKVKYGLDNKRNMTAEYMGNAIRMGIYEELKIQIPTEIKLEECIFSFYRDLVEGGKPQFLFYLRLPELTVEKFENQFFEIYQQEGKENQKEVITDGSKFEYFTIEEMRTFNYICDGFKMENGTKFKMMPSAVVSMILLLKHLE